ncbi:glycosyltransferase family 4 protein [Prochlorococcus marinus]|uniref:Glycosyl transferase n=1 Tax=Prochlorococcus marinus str. GP2 TaxID=59925 RepID=A0A0A1Z6T1_PROMR|nr:glycosyltransferase family 4 protein [Prochlorococcus marinus]KGF85302.1 glycosyl transferase [Prochlorococcus marinus str. GP2]
MKVLYITPFSSNSNNYFNSIYREGHDITLLTDDLTFHLQRFSLPSFESSSKQIIGPYYMGILKKVIYKLNFSRQLIYFFIRKIDESYYKYLRKLKNERFDIVISYRDIGLEYIQEFKKKGAIFIVEEVNTHPDFMNKLLKREAIRLGLNPIKNILSDIKVSNIKEAYEKSDYILCSSKHVYRTIKKRTQQGKKFIINPYGCPYPLIKKEIKEFKKINLLCIARIHLRKGIHYLLDVYELLNQNFPEKYTLTIVGGISSDPGFNFNKVNANIKFLGSLSKDKIKKLFIKSHIFVLPTIEEGQAIVIGEALSHGLPIISTPLSGTIDYIKNNELLEKSYKNLSIQIIQPSNIRIFYDSIIKLSNINAYKKASESSLLISSQNTWNLSGQELVKKLSLI